MLQERHIPFILLTNGGGKTEEEHVALIGKRLGVSLSEDQFVQSHTPYRDLVPVYGDQNILAIGGADNNIRKVAKHYGFQKVFTPSDFLLASEAIHPFPEMTRSRHMEIADPSRADRVQKREKVAAIMIWSSPRDWCLDVQILLDLLRPEDKDGPPNHNPPQDDRPVLYACNPDFEWATEYEQPRLAQGAFVDAFKGIWKGATKGQTKLKYVKFGKPTQTTFGYGEKTLQKYSARLNEENGTSNQIKTVYMIGDNPESDIQGCNNYNSPFQTVWKSVLVETGVFRAGSVPTHTPTWIARSCENAVQWALQQEGHEAT